MTLTPNLIARLEQRSGTNLHNPSDKDFLALAESMQQATQVHLGLNTLKRLFGRIDDGHQEFRISTLNAIARYLDFADWQQLQEFMERGSSTFHAIEGELRTADLAVGQQVMIAYTPDRQVTFLYQGNDEFEVIKAENSKLQVADLCTITAFVRHYPLIITRVVRRGQLLGAYTAARMGGLTSLTIEV
ncbi:MAG: hypothetical protein Q4B58_05325 [Bacteroidales bacterium]|nr:hypothetical protein [Bacteroidales bacterium]